MSTDVLMPQMGESIAEGTITKWLVAVGDQVERDQPLLEISTDKVDAEIPSPVSGTLLEIKHGEGTTVEVDQVIASIGSADETAASSSAAPAPEAAPAEEPAVAAESPGVADDSSSAAETLEERVRRFSSPVVRKIAAEEGVDLDEVDGSGIHGRVTKQDILQYLDRREEPGAPASADSEPEAPPAAAVGSSNWVSAADRPQAATPAASAQQAAPAPPSQPAAPSQASAASRPAEQEPAAASTATPSSSPGSGLVRSESSSVERQESKARVERGRSDHEFSVAAYGEDERVRIEPMTPIRKLTAAHMLYSKDTAAHVTTVFDCDLSAVVTARNRAKRLFQEKTGTKLTFMPFLFKAVIDGLRTYPKFNASVDGTDVVYKEDIHLGMAVALDWGLLVPVIHHADRLNLVGLSTHANDLADRARTKRLQPDEVRGGTFTVTNPGVFGSLFGTPIINQPQVAILCIGAIEKRAVVITDAEGNDGIGIRSMAYLALSYDHRLIDGADAERFMVRVKQTLTESSWDELSPFVE